MDETCESDLQAAYKYCDVLIIGAGPAGISCALWLTRLGIQAWVLEAADAVGGLCLHNDLAGGWEANAPMATGLDTAKALAQTIALHHIPVLLQQRVSQIHAQGQHYCVHSLDSEGGWQVYHTRFVVLATGVCAKGLPEVALPHPNIWVGPGNHIWAQNVAGKKIAVLGGGDNAFENAVWLAEQGAEVEIYARHVRAQPLWQARFGPEQVHVGACDLQAASLGVNGKTYDAWAVFYGWQACVPAGLSVALDARGFIASDAQGLTSLPRVYAIGEVTQKQHPCIATAMAEGVVAAKAIANTLACE